MYVVPCAQEFECDAGCTVYSHDSHAKKSNRSFGHSNTKTDESDADESEKETIVSCGHVRVLLFSDQ